MRHWLMKVEPDVYSIDDLKKDGTTSWEGVRNYQARNLLRDEIKKGDLVLFYHSSTEPMGVAGIAEVTKGGYPDHFAFKKGHDYFDPKSKKDEPTWFMVDIKFIERFHEIVPLKTLKATPGLDKMMVTQRGSRLSVQPVTPDEFKIVRDLGRKGKR